jgi:hypothetical protein
MTPEERQMLTDFANKFAQTPAPPRDPEAEDFIRSHIGNRPDALYMMTQTVLLQNMALEHAQQEIEQLKRQAPQSAPQGQGSFLGGGGRSWNAPPPPPQEPQYAPAPQMQGGGMGSFLRSAGTTAAGIAAGALAFEGIRSLFGGAEHMFGFGNQPHLGSGFLGGVPGGSETIINNYYDQPEGESRIADDLGPDDSADYDDTDVEPEDDSSSDDDFSSGNDDLV